MKTGTYQPETGPGTQKRDRAGSKEAFRVQDLHRLTGIPGRPRQAAGQGSPGKDSGQGYRFSFRCLGWKETGRTLAVGPAPSERSSQSL